MKRIQVKKGALIQLKGATNTRVYQVEQGLLRSYSIDKKGREHIFMFAPEGWTIADARASNESAELFIDALEDSTILIYPKEVNSETLNLPQLLKRISVLQNRVIMLMSASALERYDQFIETYPQILQRVPQKMIASYLGITPEALSKAKGDRARGK